MKQSTVAVIAALLALGFGADAAAGGVDAETDKKPAVIRMGGGESRIRISHENGVAVYRGEPARGEALAGGTTPAIKEKTLVVIRKKIIEHRYHARIRHLRTQGFYSGHPGKSRRFTQGFYSGPVDKGRR